MVFALAESFHNLGTRIELLIGGPPTIGKGAVAALDKAEMIRAHFNIENQDETSKKYEESCKYYDDLSGRMVGSNLTLDVYGFCVDQFGIAELRTLVQKTGGLCVIQEEFSHTQHT